MPISSITSTSTIEVARIHKLAYNYMKHVAQNHTTCSYATLVGGKYASRLTCIFVVER